MIFASGLRYVGAGTTALGRTLAATLIASIGIWLAWARPWPGRRTPAPELAGSGAQPDGLDAREEMLPAGESPRRNSGS